MDQATQEADIQRIRQVVTRIDSVSTLQRTELTQIFDELESYECWGPYFRLIKRVLADAKQRKLEDFVRLARAQNRYLEDIFAAAETCVNLVQAMQIGYVVFSEEVLPHVVENEDFAAEATIASAISQTFSSKSDQVACLERLCMLYEKKTHNENQLASTYERLIKVDPRNVKALRYFKLVFTQDNRWDDVVGILKTLLECVTHPQEHFRVAQELAAIHLYQLDRAQDAIEVLDAYCSDSPLDTSTILFDAYNRLADWPGCLRVLRECLLNVDDDTGRSILHYKIANLQEHLGQTEEAQENYEKSSHLWPIFFDAAEGAINLAISKHDWPRVHQLLVDLSGHVQDHKLAGQIRQAYKRLGEGLSQGSGSG